jgi:tRNA(Arg) A34 adenosine deaminase TadA
MYDEKFMRRAIEISAQAMDTPGTKPYGAVVVKDGKIVGEGLNHAPGNYDPTSHGEVEAIRDACRKLKTTDLSGCDLYTSCEPCPLCVSTMMISNVARMYYAASGAQSDSVIPRPAHLPADRLRAQLGLPTAKRELPSEQKLDGDAFAVWQAWVKKQK